MWAGDVAAYLEDALVASDEVASVVNFGDLPNAPKPEGVRITDTSGVIHDVQVVTTAPPGGTGYQRTWDPSIIDDGRSALLYSSETDSEPMPVTVIESGGGTAMVVPDGEDVSDEQNQILTGLEHVVFDPTESPLESP